MNAESTPETRAPRPTGEDGFSLLEISVAMVVLAVGSMLSMSLLVSTLTLEFENRTMTEVTTGTVNVLEEMQAMEFEDLFAQFNRNPDDDPDQTTEVRGDTFTYDKSTDSADGTDANAAIDGRGNTIDAIDPDVDLAVDVKMPLDGDGKLDETAMTIGGLQIDINGDGQISSGDVSGDYKVLPMMLTLTTPDGKQIQIPRLFIFR